MFTEGESYEKPRTTPGLRLLTKVLRELVTRQRFTSFADVKAAFRLRLSRLVIRYRQDEFDDAYSLVGSNTSIVHQEAPRLPTAVVPTHDGLSREDAAIVLNQLREKFGSAVAIRAVPRVRLMRQCDADRVKAAQMVSDEILRSIARCEALEREVESK